VLPVCSVIMVGLYLILRARLAYRQI